jgi:aryl-alcohol dehydrogenase-like predicted oxidoreductase
VTIVLGSAQFGLNYGITNTSGKVSLENVCDILALANKNNINVIDTSTQYGESEKTIGLATQHINKKFNMVTKTRSFENLNIKQALNYLDSDFANSINNLKDNNIKTLLFHDFNDLLGDKADSLYQAALNLKTHNSQLKIGVSVYSPNELLTIMDRYPIEVVQFPLNIFDQRFIPLLDLLKNRNIEIHTRSTFLQGVLLQDIDNNSLPKFFNEFINYFDKYSENILQAGFTRLQACIDFAKKYSDNLVLGVADVKQLEEIILAFNQDPDERYLVGFLKYFANMPLELIDPRGWHK